MQYGNLSSNLLSQTRCEVLFTSFLERSSAGKRSGRSLLNWAWCAEIIANTRTNHILDLYLVLKTRTVIPDLGSQTISGVRFHDQWMCYASSNISIASMESARCGPGQMTPGRATAVSLSNGHLMQDAIRYLRTC